MLCNGPGNLFRGLKKGETIEHQKIQKFFTFHAESQNYARLTIPIPAVATIGLFARLDLIWDLTPWMERSLNFKLYKENKKRIKFCGACLHKNQSFCDWRVVLGSDLGEADGCLDA